MELSMSRRNLCESTERKRTRSSRATLVLRRRFFAGILTTGFCGMLSAQAAETSFPPEFSEIKAQYEPSERVLLDRNGLALDEWRVDTSVRRLTWTELKEISPAMREALLLSEDQRFFSHSGVDWWALSWSALQMPFTKTARGASTISMQLTQFLNENLARHGRRSFEQKWDQIKAALDLEKVWSKEQILEAYINLVTFRGELQGLRAASRGLFGKEPHGLNREEAATLSVLIRSPNATTEKTAWRACLLLGTPSDSSEGDASETENTKPLPSRCEPLKARIATLFAKPYEIAPSERLAPVLASKLLPLHVRAQEKAHASREVKTTLERNLQKYALLSLRQQLNILGSQNVKDGAVLVLDNRTGDVLAYVANGGASYSSASYVDGVLAKRQAGSTLKPFLCTMAIDKRLLTPASWLDDSPSDFDGGSSGVYRPRNYDNQFHGLVTVRDALASSLNVPAVKTLLLLNESPALEMLRALGVRDLNEPGTYGPSLALGTVDVSLWELTNAYRALARGGVVSGARISRALPITAASSFSGAFSWPTPPKAQRVFSEEASYLVADILSDREARRLAFGLESPLATRHWTAVKTGTSKDMRDNWCVGFSDRYTVGVWVGNFSGASMWNVSGVSGAAPIWLEVMEYLHSETANSQSTRLVRQAKRPSSLVEAEYSYRQSDGKELKRKELFIAGTEPRDSQERANGRPQISYPSQGLLIALDPDIPSAHQRVPMEAERASASMKLFLDTEDLGPATETAFWRPMVGRHALELRSESGAVLDRVEFEVR